MELNLYFKKTILDKIDFDIDRLAKMLIEENIDCLIDTFINDAEIYLPSITDKTDEILECEDENLSKISKELKACLLSLCKK